MSFNGKVVHYAPLFRPHQGGVESHLLNMLHFMADLDTTIVTNMLPGVPRAERLGNARVVRIGPPDIKNSGKRLPLPLHIREGVADVLDVSRSRRKRAWLARNQFDILHVHSIYDVDAALRWSRRLRSQRLFRLAVGLYDFQGLGRPTVFTEHGVVAAAVRWGPTWTRMMWEVLGRFKNVICAERRSYDLLIRHQIKQTARVWLIPNGVRLDIFKPRPLGFSDRLRVGYASRLDKEGMELLAAVVRLLPKTVELVVAGAGRGMVSLPPALDRSPNVTVHFGIPYERMPDFYGGVHILLETHAFDTYGLSVLEAMACGRPVVRTVGEYRYPVAPGLTGFLAGPTPAEIAGTIAEIAAHPDELTPLARNARSVIEREFDAEIMAKKIRAVYSEVSRR